MTWEDPTQEARDLIRQAAELAVSAPDQWVGPVHEATLSAPSTVEIAADPALADAIRRANFDNLFAWATANVRAPGDRVPPNTSAVQLDVARDLVRRGLDEVGLDAYRTGQNVAWRSWMQICFGLTRDVDVLEEVLMVSAASITDFVDGTIAAVADRMAGERDELTRGSQAERRDLVTLLLEGAPVSRSRAESVLAHRLDGPHTAAVVWTLDRSADLGQLERVAEALMRAAGARQRLTVVASAGTLWVWLPVAGLPDRDQLGALLARTPEVRVAVGTPARDVEGFRRSHQDALEVRRLVARLGTTEPMVTFAEVELAALVTRDAARAEEFVDRVLGDLAGAAPEVLETIRVYLAALGNASTAATQLFTHRNTVLRRLARADELLPRPLAEDPLRVAVALEVLRWRASG
ncbi:transcriptional regulator [Nocardioides sp. Root190]|uniref:PucR family transcriptional regulator n=1 Tax=Nocardioides sp. Root190 TaxID=1736488 RepID=UPI0006F7390E|nr:PucR family transcriptional regulator [Nocardioides sp. Root190]KRB76447.1 transcriptional regulator [Nocardioides sp. Root190]